MNNYLAIITTVLVITQVIRVLQNRVQLKRYAAVAQKEIERLGGVTDEDLEAQKQYYRLAVEWLLTQKEEKTATWEETTVGYWRCSKCMAVRHKKETYCPRCGREMVETFKKA
jgi:uncharacterized paraquat-inducible protein A